ncbi:hypothetical protein ANN_09322 [Periplaneta americana]|uniref:Uncharacterized protein n=1 Tax=Periplaneta americana TaxID=6978 RepID=A0ABQ8TN86_PERAM|nr:hypothetical protein ANN_09322 [Periplaneta americana]
MHNIRDTQIYSAMKAIIVISYSQAVIYKCELKTNVDVDDGKKKNIYNPSIPYYLQKYQLKELEVIGRLLVGARDPVEVKIEFTERKKSTVENLSHQLRGEVASRLHWGAVRIMFEPLLCVSFLRFSPALKRISDNLMNAQIHLV